MQVKTTKSDLSLNSITSKLHREKSIFYSTFQTSRWILLLKVRHGHWNWQSNESTVDAILQYIEWKYSGRYLTKCQMKVQWTLSWKMSNESTVDAILQNVRWKYSGRYLEKCQMKVRWTLCRKMSNQSTVDTILQNVKSKYSGRYLAKCQMKVRWTLSWKMSKICNK